jgi:hypothetical protein
VEKPDDTPLREPTPPPPVFFGPEPPDLTLPLSGDTAHAILHESYWRSRAQSADWLSVDPADSGNSWKSTVFERSLAELACQSSSEALERLALAAAPFVRGLALVQPPSNDMSPPTFNTPLLLRTLHSSLVSLSLRPSARHALGDSEVAALNASLPLAESLTTLSLSLCRLTDAQGMTLASALAQNRSVVSLTLTANELGDAAVAALAPLLASSASPLELLELDDNRIGKLGAAVLGSALAQRTRPMLRLNLSQNPLNDDGVSGLLLCLAPQHEHAGAPGRIAQLGLACTGAGLRSAVALCAALRSSHSQLAGCHVDMSACASFTAECADKLEHAFASSDAHPRLGSLRLRGCALPAARIEALERAAGPEHFAAGEDSLLQPRGALLWPAWAGTVVDHSQLTMELPAAHSQHASES